MEEEEFLTLTLPERIKWLHGPHGPRGRLSHDRFAKILGTTRQSVINWEKGANEPRGYREKLAEFSGFSPEAFSRRGAEEPAAESIGGRLEALEAAVEQQGRETTRALRALTRAIERLERRLDAEDPPATVAGSV